MVFLLTKYIKNTVLTYSQYDKDILHLVSLLSFQNLMSVSTLPSASHEEWGVSELGHMAWEGGDLGPVSSL